MDKKQYTAEWYQKNKEKRRQQNAELYQRNKEKINQQRKIRYENNKKKSLKQSTEWAKNNPERIKEIAKNFYLKNRERILEKQKEKHLLEKAAKPKKEKYTLEKIIKPKRIKKTKEDNTIYQREYRKKRRAEDIVFRIRCNLGARLRCLIKKKSRRTMDFVGCSIEELFVHLESKFQEGMSWENYGKWHIDHIRPCASFNLVNEEEQRQCFHYTNLQPLWAIENIRKSNKY